MVIVPLRCDLLAEESGDRRAYPIFVVRSFVEKTGERSVCPHVMVAGSDRLLQFVVFLAIIIMQREQGIGRFGADVSDGRDLVVIGFRCDSLPFAKSA